MGGSRHYLSQQSPSMEPCELAPSLCGHASPMSNAPPAAPIRAPGAGSVAPQQPSIARSSRWSRGPRNQRPGERCEIPKAAEVQAPSPSRPLARSAAILHHAKTPREVVRPHSPTYATARTRAPAREDMYNRRSLPRFIALGKRQVGSGHWSDPHQLARWLMRIGHSHAFSARPGPRR